MLKKIMKVTVALALVGAFTANSGMGAYASSISDLQKKQQQIKSGTNNTKKLLDEAKKQKTEYQHELDVFDEELAKVTDEVETTSALLELTNQELEKTVAELVQAEVNRENQYEALKERIRFMYVNGDISYLEVLFQASDLSDFLNRVELINRIVKYDQDAFKNLKETEKLIEEKYEETARHRAEIEILSARHEQRQAELFKKIGEKENLVSKLEMDEKKYTAQIKAMDDEDKSIASMIKAAQEEAARKAAASKGGAPAPYTGGKLSWPAPGNNKITSYFGNRPNPFNKKPEFHTGLDISAPVGSNIVAAEAGTVIFSGSRGGYGLAVIIDHGGTLSTLYGHNSKLLVDVGTTVKKGQTIAKAGSTGYSTGPHCHFEVRINGVTTDPTKYLKG